MSGRTSGSDGERLLVVVAHPDDETFGCGSLLAHAPANGVTTVVACATRGEAGTPRPGSGLDHADMAVVREDELRAAAALLGVAQVELFSWVDSGMHGDAAPETLFAAPLDEVARLVAGVIDAFEPDVVVTLDGSDGHRDHIHIRDATLLATERAAYRTPRVYLHCLPQSLMQRWVEELMANQSDTEHLALGQLGTAEELTTTVIDTTEHLDRREAAIALHASQTSPYEVMPADLRLDFLTGERLRRVVPPWTGGRLETRIFS